MKKIVLTFGLISGAIMSAMMLLTVPLFSRGAFRNLEILGYTTMLLAFLLVFFGVRSYRDNVGGGTIGFGRAFTVGLLIMLVACACYVVTWEFIYFKLAPDFADKFAAYQIEQARAKGASPETIEATAKQMQAFKRLYDMPLVNAAITFLEPLPVGLPVTLITAGVLRTRRQSARRAVVV